MTPAPDLRVRAAGAAAVILLAVAAYWPSFSAGWHFDDFAHIVNNRAIQARSFSFSALKRAALDSPIRTRPAANVSFALNWMISGNRTWSYHALNFALHLASAVLVFYILRALYAHERFRGVFHDPDPPALLGAAVFALHPVQVQSVTYIVQRMNLLCGLMVLAAVFIWLGLRDREESPLRHPYRLAAFALAALVALMAKENAVNLALFIPLLDFILGGKSAAQWARDRRVYLLCGLVIIAAASAVYARGAGGLFTGYRLRDYAMFERLLTQPRVVLWYVSLYFFPPGRLALDHYVETSTGLFSPGTTGPAIALLAGLTLLALVRLRRAPLLCLGWLWFVAGLALESSILPLEMAYEHRLYLPSLGLIMIATDLVRRLRPGRRFIPIAAALCLLLAANTFARNRVWRDEITLWSDSVRKSPAKARPWENLCSWAYLAGDLKSAEGWCGRAIVAAPQSGNGWYQLGLALYRQGKYRESEQALGRTVELLPRRSDAWYQLGRARVKLGKPDQALADYQRALELEPTRALFWHQYGMVLIDQGDLDNGRKALLRARASLRPGEERLGADIASAVTALEGGLNIDR